MPATLNKVMILGNLGADPEIHKFEDGGTLARISVATKDKFKHPVTGKEEENTEWHRIVFYRRQAEIVEDNLQKGSYVLVEGALKTRSYTDQKSGEKKYVTEIRGFNLRILGGWKNQGQQAPDHDRGTTSRQQPKEEYNPPPADDYDDDIPF